MSRCNKVEKKSEILENFKKAIGSTAKSLSNTEEVEVSFGNKNIKSEKVFIKLPEIEQINNKINYDQIRAIADSESLKLRFSDNIILKSYEPVFLYPSLKDWLCPSNEKRKIMILLLFS